MGGKSLSGLVFFIENTGSHGSDDFIAVHEWNRRGDNVKQFTAAGVYDLSLIKTRFSIFNHAHNGAGLVVQFRIHIGYMHSYNFI